MHPRTTAAARRRSIRYGIAATLTAFGAALLATHAEASLVRVNLGIYGGSANDLATYVGSGGNTRLIAAVRGDVGAVRLNNAGTRWQGVFFGRPGEIREVETDLTDPGAGSGADVIFALTLNGRLLSNASEVAGAWSRASWTTVTNGGTFFNAGSVVEEIVTIHGSASGTYVGSRSGNIYRTTDGGATWALLATPVVSGVVESIAAYVDDPTNPTIYTVVDNAGASELYKLTFAGTYSVSAPVTVTGSGGVIERVHVYPSTTIPEAPLLFVTGDSPSQAVYRGENDGASWSTVSESFHYFQAMEFDVVNDRIYAVAGYSNDRGLTFAQMPNLTRVEGDIHSNDGAVAVDPNDASRVWWGSDWFVGEYTESAGTWTAAGDVVDADGVTAVLLQDIHQIADTSTTKETFIIGGKSGVGITQDFLSHGGPHPTWTYPIYPMSDGSQMDSTRLQDHDGDGTVMETVFIGNRGGKLYRSASQGLTAADYLRVFDVATDAVGYWQDSDRVSVAEIVESPSSLDQMYIAFGDWDTGRVGGAVACSTDNGATWQVDPAWVTAGRSMKVNALQITNTKFWAGVGKSDDTDPTHAGLYAKIGSLSGCGAGTWTQESTGTDLDTGIVYDLDGPTTSPVYVAASTGLFRGELSGSWTWEELTGSADPELAELPSGVNDEYSAVAYNPAPSGYDEEIYAATDDSVYRIRLAGSTWTVDLISPTPHEEVSVLLWDDLVVATNGSLSTLGAATKDQGRCATAVRKARTGYVKNALKAMATCRDAYLAGGPSCPDAAAIAALDDAAAKIDLAGKCSDDTIQQLEERWSAGCFGASTTAELDACTLADAEAAVQAAIATEYGAESAGRVGVAVGCQSGIGKAYARGMLAKALKAIDKCDRDIERGRRVSCPDDASMEDIADLQEKAASTLMSSCSNADVLALNALGFGGTCAGSTTVSALTDCLAGDHEDILLDLITAPTDSF